MIIKINNNFTNNIGEIEITPREILPSTQAFLDIYNKTWSSSQQFAIEDFLTAFNASSFKTKVKNLVVPIFSPTQTIANGNTPIAFYDIITETTLTTAYRPNYGDDYKIISNGISREGSLASQSVDAGLQISLDETITLDDFHQGVYYKDDYIEERYILNTSSNVGSAIRNTRISFGHSSTKLVSADYPSGIESNLGLRLMSYDETTDTVAGTCAGQSLTNIVVNDTNPTFTALNITNILDRYSPNKTTSIQAITHGLSLTQTEVNDYETMLDSLMTKLYA